MSYFSSSSVLLQAFSALCVRYVCIRRSGIILTPKATFMPNFVFVMPSTAELARGEKMHTQSVTQSLTQSPSLFDVPGTEAFT